MRTIQEIIARLAEIRADIETRGDAITAEELSGYEAEIQSLTEQRSQLENAAQRRQQMLNSIAAGTQGVVLDTPGSQRGAQGAAAPVDPYGTTEYRQAFMEYCRTGAISPILRADQVTTTTDISAAVPTTILNEVIRKLGSYGQLFSRVRKTAVKGGMSVPILSIKPVATWITETTSSNRQKLQANTSVTFNYYGLECKISQSLIATIVGLEAFESAITDLIVEAMVAKMEEGIVKGTGTGQMLGVTVDTRVPAENKVTITAANFGKWDAWKKQVFAKMPIKYKAKASFVMAAGTWEGYIDGMVDQHGQPIGRVNYGITDGIQERFGGKEVIQVEDDIITPYDDAAAGDVIAIFMPLGDYCINSNMQLTMRRYFDEDKNEWVDKAILVADGKILDPNGVILVLKG